MKDSTTGKIEAAAGIGLALGAAALGAFIATRKSGEGKDDAPWFTRRGEDVVGRTVTIRKPRAELYAFWREFTNLAQFMENLEKVTDKGGGRSVWTIKAPAGQTVDVETEIAEETENALIAWRSVEGAPGDRGTRVGLVIAYDPPGGELGKAIAKLFRREPAIQARHDLKRFKMLMETGEIATSARRKEDTRAAKQQEKEREDA